MKDVAADGTAVEFGSQHISGSIPVGHGVAGQQLHHGDFQRGGFGRRGYFLGRDGLCAGAGSHGEEQREHERKDLPQADTTPFYRNAAPGLAGRRTWSALF